ncbi:hypothetical protein [Bacillus sp. T33-2]|nr:hypothetical protein [Bacillus sp. T33-2]
MPEDRTFEIEDISILINEKDKVYFENTKLDYVKDVFGSGRFQLLKV